MRRALLSVVIVLLVAGCGQSGPPSTNTSSKKFATLADKVTFLQKYVRFRHNYHQLDFAIQYSNNSGGLVPGPSEWDVRIVAVVPPGELGAWTSGLTPATSPDTGWLADVPTSIDHSAVTQWFKKGGVVVGVDKVNSVVVYRNLAM
jgi:hypothetical protein